MRPSLSLLVVVFPLVANALPSGITGYSGKGGSSTCNSCHGAGALVPTVALTGPATLTAGMTGTYTLTVTGGPGKGAGMNAALSGANSANAVFTAGTGNKVSNGEVVHSGVAAVTANVATFTFTIKAPLTAGLFTISAAGLSINNDGATSGDGTGSTSLGVTVTTTPSSPPVGTADAGGLPPVVVPATDAGTTQTPAPVTPAPTVSADGGTKPAEVTLIPTPTGGTTAPQSDGVVEGEGCSSASGVPLLGLFAMLALVWARRSKRVLAPVSRS